MCSEFSRVHARVHHAMICKKLQLDGDAGRRTQDMSDEFAEPELLDPFSAAEIAAQSVLEQESLA